MLYTLSHRRSLMGATNEHTHIQSTINLIQQMVVNYNRSTRDGRLWMVIAGGFALRFNNSLSEVPFGDVDLFFGYTGSAPRARLFVESVSGIFQGTYETGGSLVGGTLSNTKFSTRGQVYNLILQAALNTNNGVERLLNEFDLDILQSCRVFRPNGTIGNLGTARFREAYQSKLVSCHPNILLARKVKYKGRLEELGYDFSWELN